MDHSKKKVKNDDLTYYAFIKRVNRYFITSMKVNNIGRLK